jgi:hypothetical protein
LVFFYEIAKSQKEPKDYVKAISEILKGGGLNTQISHQIYEISNVAIKKFDLVAKSIVALFVGVLAGVLIIVAAFLT